MKEAKEGRKECITNVLIAAVNGLSEPETLVTCFDSSDCDFLSLPQRRHPTCKAGNVSTSLFA